MGEIYMGKRLLFLTTLLLILGGIVSLIPNNKEVESSETEEDEVFGMHENALILDTAIEEKMDKYDEDEYYVLLETMDGNVELKAKSEEVLKVLKKGERFNITFSRLGYIKEIGLIRKENE
jgi:hypothetical protein